MEWPKITREDILSETYPGEARYKALQRFADEVAAAEREACARLAESMDDGTYDAYHGRDIAAAIRARSQR